MVFPRPNKSNHSPSCKEAIVTTLLYNDIFHFAPTKEELWELLISTSNFDKETFGNCITKLLQTGEILQKNNVYFLPGKESYLERRKESEHVYHNKYLLAQKVGEILAYIPTILFIGISGSLAVKNARKNDDIDLFIITKKHSLYKTRFVIAIVLEILGLRRKRFMKFTEDSICVNLLIDETALYWDKRLHSVYTAREITQIIPLFQRNNMYQHFLDANMWIRLYLPNYLERIIKMNKNLIAVTQNFLLFQIILFIISERGIRMLQQMYMRKHKTNETVTNHIMAFHPLDYRTKIMHSLRLKMRELGLLTIW